MNKKQFAETKILATKLVARYGGDHRLANVAVVAELVRRKAMKARVRPAR